MSTAILFSPGEVQHVLHGMPAVAALVPDPHGEGEPSSAFPNALRKTHRELYRWIANTHYEHLADAVLHLERVHAARCRFGSLLTTRSREQFISLSAEVFVADDLLRRGYTVRTVQRSSDPSPDLHVVGDGIDVAVEVYSPRELLAFDAWQKELSDLLNYVDVAADFSSSANTVVEQPIPPPRGGPRTDPWSIAEMIATTREAVIAEITDGVEESLRHLKPLTKTYRHERTPLVTTIELYDVAQARQLGPVRRGTISIPGFSGYSPAGVFRTIVDRALRKASRRQVESVPAAARALVVYLMGTKIAEDLIHPSHLREAKAVLDGVDPRSRGLDVLAFVVRALPHGLAAIFMRQRSAD
jgi:hypothetical protein